SIKMLLQEDDFKTSLLEKISEEVIIRNHSGHLLTKKGKSVPIIYSGTPLKNKDKIIIGTVFIARDITEDELNRVELIKAKERAEESDRLKSAFLANMSHEIRTPMNGILGFAGLLKEPNLTGEEQQEFIGVIEKSGARMLNIINDIMSISKVEAGQMEVSISETNINEQIDYIYTFFKPEAATIGIQLLCNKPLSGNDTIIKTDREKVYAILTNLVKNALKFTEAGTIEFGYRIVSDKEMEGRRNVEMGEFRDKACRDKDCLVSTIAELEFFVKDTGLGVRNKQKEFIFERFRQGSESLSRNYEGAGLGLSISKAYVEMLGGQIWVESEEGKGSTFYFTLPYIQKSKKIIMSDSEIISDVKEIQMNKIQILIAEDDEASEKLLTATIKKFSKEILKAVNGAEAVEACRNNPDIDLVLMDIKMPVMDGYEATRQIRQFNTKVVIIAQSAYALTGDREKAIDAGCNDYITKPMKLKALIELIRKYFEN
ncbi:MAG: response regulator, partial [Mariniphaga sp.]|nr:response regulator [Mariniphaga sp.]